MPLSPGSASSLDGAALAADHDKAQAPANTTWPRKMPTPWDAAVLAIPVSAKVPAADMTGRASSPNRAAWLKARAW
jgi:hypothetical protein